MIDPLQTLLIVVSLLFAAIAAVHVALDRPTGGLLLGIARPPRARTPRPGGHRHRPARLGRPRRQRCGVRGLPPRRPGVPAAGDAVGAGRAHPRRYGGAGGGRPGACRSSSSGSSRSGLPPVPEGQATNKGWGRALILVYAVFAFSALGRSSDPAGAEGRRGAAGLRAVGVRGRRVRRGDLLPGAARPSYHPAGVGRGAGRARPASWSSAR